VAKKNDETKTPAFEWEKALDELLISSMLKAGVKYYIEVNNLTPKSDKDLEKIINDYSKIKMGD